MTSSNAEPGSAVPAGDPSFADLQIHPSVLQAVVDVGYETPSPIQAATIPAMMAGSDVVGLAQTGTGKTAAFAIPILSKIDTSSRITQELVLAPTRELAQQTAREAEWLVRQILDGQNAFMRVIIARDLMR